MKGAFDKLAEIRPLLAKVPETTLHEDEFLKTTDLVSVRRQGAENRRRMAMAELAEIFRANRWQQALELFHLIEEKLPELADLGLDAPVREKLAFAMGQMGRFYGAIAQLEICVARDPIRGD